MDANTNHVITGRIYCSGLWYIKDFFNIFLPTIFEDQKKSYHLSAEQSQHQKKSSHLSRTAPYGKSGPRYCITFIKRLHDGLR